jgi:hypothetical protein
MVAISQSVRRSEPGRGRSALLWGAAAFLLGQFALCLTLNVSRPLRDPEYGRRLLSLRERLAERAESGPLLLCLGSSRVAMGIRPALLPQNQPGARGGPVVFNFGVCRSGPVMELLCLRRLLADGIRPSRVFIEVFPFLASGTGEQQMASIQPARLDQGDRDALRPYCPDPRPASRTWWDEVVPWFSYRTHLLNQFAPSWVSPSHRSDGDWEGLDGWGWVDRPSFAAPLSGNPAILDAVRNQYLQAGNSFVSSPDSRRAYAELLTLCRAENIKATLLLMPDAFLADYDRAGLARMEAYYRELSEEFGAPLVDARHWLTSADFVEGVHTTHAGASALTERFGREVLPQFLDGGPNAPSPRMEMAQERPNPPRRKNRPQASTASAMPAIPTRR